MLANERRQRLLAAMAEAGIEQMVLYGNAWQGDDLRYASDFGILERRRGRLRGRTINCVRSVLFVIQSPLGKPHCIAARDRWSRKTPKSTPYRDRIRA
jgi:hypothetical protein